MTIHRVAIIAEAQQGRTHSAIMDLAALAGKLSENAPVRVRWLVVGSQAAEVGRKLAGNTGHPATALEMPPESALTGELLYAALHPLLASMRPDVIGMLHTSRAQDYAGALALALDAACVTGVQALQTLDETPVFQRAVFGGKWVAEIQTDNRPVVLTVLPGYFKDVGMAKAMGEVETQRLSLPATRTRLIETRESETEAALTQAETIVAAGRGIGSKDNLDIINRLSAMFPKSTVAGTRIVCDAGWLPYQRQVGATGATVAPGLYLACGISGAFQHLAGMSASRFIVAINSDPQAAIFNTADVGVVENLITFLPLLIEAIAKNRSDTEECS